MGTCFCVHSASISCNDLNALRPGQNGRYSADNKLKSILPYFDSNFTEVCSWVFNWQQTNIGYDNDFMAESRLAPSQWEPSLQCNAVSHWLDANLEPALDNTFIWSNIVHLVYWRIYASINLDEVLAKLTEVWWYASDFVCWVITGSDNGLALGQRQAITSTNDDLQSMSKRSLTLQWNGNHNIKISLKKMQWKRSSAKWRPFLGINTRSVACK